MRVLPHARSASGRALVCFGAGAVAGFLMGADSAPGYAGSAGMESMGGSSSWLEVGIIMATWGCVFAAFSVANSWALARRARSPE